MQHPEHLDEGTIHAWLDGALSAAEADGVAAHVAECARCAAAVAEARGLIAASSRILAKLDDVPGGVLPASSAAEPAAPSSVSDLFAAGVRRRRRLATFGAAAAVLFISVGTFAVVREAGRDGEPARVRFGLVRGQGERATAGEATRAATRESIRDAAASRPAAAPAPQAIEPRAPAVADSVVARAPLQAPSPEERRPRAAVADGRDAASPRRRAASAPAPSVAAAIGTLENAAPADVAPRAPSAETDAALAQSGGAGAGVAPPAAPAAEPGAVFRGREDYSAPARKAAAPVAAPRGRSVTGVVTDASTGAPVGGATVSVRGAGRGALTDSAGRYVITDVGEGARVLDARSIGYRPRSADVSVRTDSAARADLSLERSSLALSEIVVTGAGTEPPRASGRAASRNAPARLAGCYALELGEWRPPVVAQQFAVGGAFTLPGRVVLDSARVPAPMGQGFGVRDASGAAGASPRSNSYWMPIGADSVRIVWGDGAAGVELRARVDRRGLRGTAATFSDDERRPVQRSDAWARQVECGKR